jgi:hypothetical protein
MFIYVLTLYLEKSYWTDLHRLFVSRRARINITVLKFWNQNLLPFSSIVTHWNDDTDHNKEYVQMSGKAWDCRRVASHITVFNEYAIHLPSTSLLKVPFFTDPISLQQKQADNMKTLEVHSASKQDSWIPSNGLYPLVITQWPRNDNLISLFPIRIQTETQESLEQQRKSNPENAKKWFYTISTA